MPKKKYVVVREHEGDRIYREGEIRTAEEGDVAHLVPHVLAPVSRARAEATPLNKAESAAPANKVITSPKRMAISRR